MTHHFELSEEGSRCFGCGDNPWGLKLRFKLHEDGWVVAETSVHPNFPGFRNAVHGGIVATLIDEALVWAVELQEGITCPTYDVCFRIKKPVPIEEKILIRAKILWCRHSVYCVKAEVMSSQGELLATGKGRLKVVKTIEDGKDDSNGDS